MPAPRPFDPVLAARIAELRRLYVERRLGEECSRILKTARPLTVRDGRALQLWRLLHV